jgi:hypothetical protein
MAGCVWATQSERSGVSQDSCREQICCSSAGCPSKNTSLCSHLSTVHHCYSIQCLLCYSFPSTIRYFTFLTEDTSVVSCLSATVWYKYFVKNDVYVQLIVGNTELSALYNCLLPTN